MKDESVAMKRYNKSSLEIIEDHNIRINESNKEIERLGNILENLRGEIRSSNFNDKENIIDFIEKNQLEGQYNLYLQPKNEAMLYPEEDEWDMEI